MNKLTIFTPTYNRAYTLPRLYQSLCEQTDKRFEWLIVDDGSTDGTKDLVDKFVKDEKIEICYINQINGGKHRAINLAVKKAHGDFFFIVDSDDYIPPSAVKIIFHYAEQIEFKSDFAGICGFRAYQSGEIIAGGDKVHECIDENSIELRKRLHIKGDMAEVFRTEILKQYPFPEFENEKFMSEAIVWNRIAQIYKLRYFPIVIYICEYLADGLTKSIRKHHRESPKGSMLFYNEITQVSDLEYFDEK